MATPTGDETLAPPGPPDAAHPLRPLTVDILRIGMGVVWVVNLIFIANPQNGYFGSFAQTARSYAPTTYGGPGLADYVAGHATFFAWAIAITTAYLAVAFTLGATTRIACFVGSIFSAVLFATQIGTTFAFPGGTDVGPHPLYILIYAVLVIGGAGQALSLDAWASRALNARRLARPTARPTVPAVWTSSLHASTLFAYFVATTLVALAIGFALVVALPIPAAPAAAPTPTSYVNLTVDINPANGYPQYSPANLTVPVGIVVFTIIDHDMSMNWTPCPCRVSGTVGNVEYVNGTPMQVLPRTNIAHSFDIPDLSLVVYSPGQSVVQFKVNLQNPGHFFWDCTVPCGTGTDPYNSPPMGVVGYMAGSLTIT